MTAILDHLFTQFVPVIVVVAGYLLLLAIAAITSRRDQC